MAYVEYASMLKEKAGTLLDWFALDWIGLNLDLDLFGSDWIKWYIGFNWRCK